MLEHSLPNMHLFSKTRSQPSCTQGQHVGPLLGGHFKQKNQQQKGQKWGKHGTK